MATKWDNVPKLNDDVVKSTKEDLAKGQKGRNVDSSNVKGSARQNVIDAGRRADTRNLGRLAAAAGAAQLGWDAGREIDEKTGIGKAMVDKSGLGDLAAKMATSGDRVELSQDAKDRIAAGELDKKASSKPMKSRASSDSYSGPRDDIGNPKEASEPSMKRGGKVRSPASKRGDGIATKGHTKGRYM
jgi:hypothetical protein